LIELQEMRSSVSVFHSCSSRYLSTVSIVNTDRRVNVHGSIKRKIPQHLYQLNVQTKKGVAQPREMRTNEMNQQKMSLRIFRIVELVLIPLDLIALNVIAGHGKIGKK
jgi:hypothetical protein